MKELSIEEKANAYDGAIKRAKAMIKVAGNEEVYKSAITIFPELKESDERIRKALIELVRMVDKNPIGQIFGYGDIKYSDMIAWLEKQDDSKISVEEDNSPTSYGKQVDECLYEASRRYHSDSSDPNHYSLADVFYAGMRCERNLNSKSPKDVIDYADKYSHQIWKNLMDNYKKIEGYYIGCNDVSDIVLNSILNAIDWYNNNESKILGIGVEHASGVLKECIDKIMPIPNIVPEEVGQPINDADKEIVEAVKDTSILDMVESKFHEKDWVVTSYGKVNQVIAVDRDGDGFTLDDDTYFSGSWKDEYHLWTIQDAKDGDVLVTGNTPFLYSKHEKDKYGIVCFSYGGIDGNRDEFIINTNPGNRWCDVKFVKPATKEQRDLLFQKMKEAGYEWDAKKKELKNIEQKPVEWKQENGEELTKFENAMMHIGGSFFGENAGLDPNDTDTIKEQAELLLKLAPKTEWSEDDEKRINRISDFIWKNRKGDTDEIYQQEQDVNWIKSLKARIGD